TSYPGLYSRFRSRRRPLRCACLSARWRRLHDAQLWLWPWFFRAGRDRTREASTSRWSLRPARQAIRLTSSPPATVSALRSNGSRVMTICKPSSPTLWHRSAGYNAPHLTLTFADPLETASDRGQPTSASLATSFFSGTLVNL